MTKDEISPEKTEEEKEWIRESQIEAASAYTDFDTYGIDESDYIGHIPGDF